MDALGLTDMEIGDQDSAAKALNSIKSAINYVSDVRGTLGATQNRLDHTINNLSVMQENIQDAESTIRDTDVADEMMAYTKNNILIQSAQAMLAQANQVPQGVLPAPPVSRVAGVLSTANHKRGPGPVPGPRFYAERRYYAIGIRIEIARRLAELGKGGGPRCDGLYPGSADGPGPPAGDRSWRPPAIYLFANGGNYKVAYDRFLLPLPPGLSAGNSAGADDPGFLPAQHQTRCKGRYEENCRLLRKYPYLLPAGFPAFEELPLRFYPYDDQRYIPFTAETETSSASLCEFPDTR